MINRYSTDGNEHRDPDGMWCLASEVELLEYEMTQAKDKLQAENERLRKIYQAVVINCTPPDDCNDPIVLKNYMKACIKAADEYEALKEKK